ncbi:chalcone-flavanone isomerase-domain-containing protein [Catenaria anguillulae PL171]|uniref:Chalcone-flavanone isomerase-domain-containing protein n=1 Tax=Catenaria anguillulae PL171 TaxID=765915 RepID=A0A1Y2HHK0_9FUNG|nr:chalcone-flavanone isomerase-domain-containing protein [Catenaria anguillulae PL171]
MSRALTSLPGRLAKRFASHPAAASKSTRMAIARRLSSTSQFSWRPLEGQDGWQSQSKSRSTSRSCAAVTAAAAAFAAGLIASSVILADASPSGDTVVDPATGASLPRVLSVPASGNAASFDFQLVGYGARQVTFLSINVYSVGIYVPKGHFAKFASNCTSSSDCNLEASLAQTTTPLAIYLVPARNSSAAHLRDGFVRTFMTAIAKAGPEADREKMLDDVNKFKAVFPTAAVEKGHKFVFVYLPARGLRIMHQGVDQGVVESPWLGKALFEAYLRTDKPISPKLRANLIEQLVPTVPVHVSETN